MIEYQKMWGNTKNYEWYTKKYEEVPKIYKQYKKLWWNTKKMRGNIKNYEKNTKKIWVSIKKKNKIVPKIMILNLFNFLSIHIYFLKLA